MKAEAKKIIGNMIAEKRQEKGYTQQQLSDFTGLSRNYISDIENGRYAPSVEALTEIAKYLGINLNFLTSMTEIQDKKESGNK